MTQQVELVVQDGTGTDASHHRSHSLFQVSVQAGLGAVRFFQADYRPAGCARQIQFLGQRSERDECLHKLSARGTLPEACRDRFQMPVLDVHPVALGADSELRPLDVAVLALSQDLERLGLDLLLLSLDVGEHVVDDVQAGHSGISRTRECLHGHHADLFQAKGPMQRRQGQNQGNGGAVGVGDDKPRGLLACLLLPGNQSQVVRVDLGDQ